MTTLTLQERRNLAKEQYAMPYRVGDILHHSWGYEQTQCDFYQVVEVRGRVGVLLRKIAARTVPGSEGFMCDSRLPVKDQFLTTGSQALTEKNHNLELYPQGIVKRVSGYVESDTGRMRYHIPVPYGWCDLWDSTPQYCSWYG